jgi:hypothetical protein
MTSISHPINTNSSSTSSSSSLNQLLITIGPQCSGKTTFLSQYAHEHLSSIVDISMDAIPRTYEQISVRSILQYQETGLVNHNWERFVYRQSLLLRITELLTTEQIALVLLFKEVDLDPPILHCLTCPHRRYLSMNSLPISSLKRRPLRRIVESSSNQHREYILMVTE